MNNPKPPNPTPARPEPPAGFAATNSLAETGVIPFFERISFENKLILICLFFALIPLIGYAFFSLNNFRQFSLRSAENYLEEKANGIYMLCEAQEALDRLSNKQPVDTDEVTGASPTWQEGDEFKSLQTIIKSVRVAETGYAYVFDGVGLIVIHPSLEGKNYYQFSPSEAGVFVALKEKAMAMPPGEIGTLRYDWPDHEGKISTKIAKVVYYKTYDWIISVAAYEDEILAPYYRDRLFFLIILLATTVVVVLIVYIVSRLLMRTIRQLTRATTRIAEGDFSADLPQIRSRDEIGSLARSFRLMITKLANAHNDLLEWSRTLEQKVEERSRQLKEAHERVLMSQKMASLGNLSAMVAHEINNPLSGVLSYLKLTSKLLAQAPLDDKLRDSINHNLGISTAEIKRVGDIVRNLLMFSKQSFGEFGPANLCPIIDKSIALIKHSLEMQGMTLAKEVDYPHRDLLYCDASGLQQMLVALGVNAIEAMDKGGCLTIRALLASDREAKLQVIDTGKGIPEDVLPHIFEPFFSKKESKKSIGMGLAVVYGIVHSHHGHIQVESVVDKGTTFTITLPREKPADARNDAAAGVGVKFQGEQSNAT